MLINKPGYIENNLLLLGDKSVCMYLLKGDEYLLIGGGMSYIVPTIEAQFDKFKIDRSKIMGLLILHSHFDHAGAVTYFSKAYPKMEIFGSKGVEKIFGMEKAVKITAKLDKAARQRFGVADQFSGISLELENPYLTKVLTEGDNLELGNGVNVSIYDTPGHSKCSMMAYVPDQKYLFPSDGMPIPVLADNNFIVMANDNLPIYLKTLERIKELNTLGGVICFEHGGAFIGEDADTYMQKAIELTRNQYEFYRQELEKGADPVKLVKTEVAKIMADGTFNLITEEILTQVFTSMVLSVKAVQKHLV